MRHWFLAAAILLACGSLAHAESPGFNSGICSADDEIAPAERKAASDAALALVQAMISGDDAGAFATMTTDAQAGFGKDKFGEFIHMTNTTLGPFHDPAVTHVYMIDSAGTGPDARAPCGTLSGDRWVMLEVKPGRHQAHVVVTAQSQNNGWEFNIWLLPEGGGWRAQYVHLNASAIAGHSVDDMLALTRRERDAGRTFNAAVLYRATLGLTDRGPAFQLGVAQTVRGDMAQFTPPPELQGQMPFTWTLGGKAYMIADAGLMGIAKDIGLVFVLPRKDWPSDAEVDAQGRAFIDAFRALHPDYANAFGFILVRSMKPDNSGGFGTVYDNVKGYD